MGKAWIVVPCYNEEKRLELDRFSTALTEYSWLNICFVDDGSSDKTYMVLSEYANNNKNRVKVITNPVNLGKAGSVRNGILEGLKEKGYDYYGYLDADLSITIFDLAGMYIALNSSDEKMLAMAARVRLLGRDIVAKGYRNIIGNIFTIIASAILRVRIFDTQCGGKLFTKSFAEIVFKDELETSWCFDIELLLRLQKHYSDPKILKRVVIEYPLTSCVHVEGSKVKASHILSVVGDLLRLMYKSRT